MKKLCKTALFLLCFSTILSAGVLHAARGDAVRTSEPFTGTVVADGFDMPWNVAWGPDDMIWITERMGRRILRVNPQTGEHKVATTIYESHAEGAHEGVLGMAFGPDFRKLGDEGHVYVCYTYRPEGGNVDSARKRIVRYLFDHESGTLGHVVTIIDALPAGDDHNGGRLVVGPDRKLYLSLGELGHNQGANLTKPNGAQRLPTQAEVDKKDWAAYTGKILRIDMDGSIPEDNPLIADVKSHIYTYGHRNPQGLAFIGENLFSCEHGPSVDDEVNRLVPGGNYGWPHVAGFRDNQSYHFIDFSKASAEAIKGYDPSRPDTITEGLAAVAQKETDWSDPHFVEPLRTFHTVPNGYNFKDDRFSGDMGYIFWPTVGPSSLAYYPANGPIEGWGNSLLMTTLKTGKLYLLRMNDDKKTVQGDELTYFASQNRYRDLCLSPDDRTIYIITDTNGNALGRDGRPTTKMENPGALIAFTYAPAK